MIYLKWVFDRIFLKWGSTNHVARFQINHILAVISRGDDSVSAADMGLALTYAQSITQILNFLIRVTAELEVNVSVIMT